MSTPKSSALSFLFLSTVFVHSTYAYFIDQGCNPAQRTAIQQAIDEAKNMASYGDWRIQQKKPTVGPAAEQLLGAFAEQDFRDKMRMVPGAFGQNNGIGNGLGLQLGQDLTMVIKCGSAHLTQNPNGPREWLDPDFANAPAIVSMNPSNAQARPCTQASGEMARTYLTFKVDQQPPVPPPNHPEFVVMLCTAYPNAALALAQATIGTDWRTREWDGDSGAFNAFSMVATSVTMLHEALHAIWFFNIQERITGQLPNGDREQYDFNSIEKLPDQSKVRNAHSYAMLATAMWFKRNTITKFGSMGPRFRIDPRGALDMPGDPHP